MSRSKAAVAAALLLSVAVPAAAKPICYTPSEVRAMQFRQLQVELMVAALKCRSADPTFQDRYAGYIGKVSGALSENAKDLKAMFTRLGKGAGHIDRYVTELSNDASMRSLAVEYGEYCAAQDEVLNKILSMKAHEIEAYAADTVEKPYSPASCNKPAPIKQAKTDVKVKAKQGATAAEPTKKTAGKS